MKTKIVLKILALACALVVVVSCITPCIAVNNSTNNISNADVTLEGASYIIVHTLNPEGIEIAIIDGMELFVSALVEGVKFTATSNGTYRFTIMRCF